MKKKNKLTINTLAMGNLKQRKKQYTILIIGIILAMVFSSGTIFFISCSRASGQEFAKRQIGNFYAYCFASEGIVDAQQGKKDGYIEEYGYAHILSYAFTNEKELDQGTPIAKLDENAEGLYYPHFTQGRYPEKQGEIAVEKDALLRLGLNPVVGEKITLSLLTANGDSFLQSSKEEKTYTLVGILTDKRKNIEDNHGKNSIPPIPAAFVSTEEELSPGGKEILSIYFNPTYEALHTRVDIQVELMDGTTLTDSESLFHSEFLSPLFERIKSHPDSNERDNFIYGVNFNFFRRNEAVYNSLFLTTTLAAVLMLASCIGIINAFSTNLKERKKQIGMLRALGTTKRQIINIFGREAFIITLICTPVSILVSYFGVKLYAAIMGDDFIFMPNIGVLLICAAVSVICVMLAALTPLLIASKTSPMQAIRNVELSRKMKRKRIKSQKSFKVPKLLSQRSISFYRSRQIGVTLILVITIFISSFGFSLLRYEFTSSSWDKSNSADYIIRRNDYPEKSQMVNLYNIDKGITLNTIRDVLDYPMFSSAYGGKIFNTYLTVDEYDDYMNLLHFGYMGFRYVGNDETQNEQYLKNAKEDELFDLFFEGESEYYKNFKQLAKTDKEILHIEGNAFDSALIKKHLKDFEVIDGKIDLDKLDSGEEIILVACEELGYTWNYDSKGRISSMDSFDMTEPLPPDFGNRYEKIYATARLGYKAGDTVNLRTLYSDRLKYDWESEEVSSICDKEVRIGAIVKEFSFDSYMTVYDNLGIVTSVTGLSKLTDKPHGYEFLLLDYEGEITDETDIAATQYLDSVLAGGYFKSVSGYANEKESRQWAKTLMISLLSIVILMFSVCASIVNNALTAKIRESKKEIGTLRAVGASVKELTSAYIRQLVSMFSWGMGIGLGGYTVMHIGFKLYFKDAYSLPYLIWPSIVICLLLCIICSVNLYAKIKQEMKHSIVENIREL